MSRSSDLLSGNAQTTRAMFSRETRVSTEIRATCETIWSLLTDAERYPHWNSTVVSIRGQIASGQSIGLESNLSPGKTFRLKVKTFEPPRRMVWGSMMGSRSFRVESIGNGMARFEMSEKIGGPLFPLFARLIPPFDDSFNQFAADLKATAEKAD